MECLWPCGSDGELVGAKRGGGGSPPGSCLGERLETPHKGSLSDSVATAATSASFDGGGAALPCGPRAGMTRAD
jgi:hypothetical protein